MSLKSVFRILCSQLERAHYDQLWSAVQLCSRAAIGSSEAYKVIIAAYSSDACSGVSLPNCNLDLSTFSLVYMSKWNFHFSRKSKLFSVPTNIVAIAAKMAATFGDFPPAAKYVAPEEHTRVPIVVTTYALIDKMRHRRWNFNCVASPSCRLVSANVLP